MADQNLTMVRGDTLAFGLEYDGTEQDLDSAYFTVKNSADAVDPVAQLSIGFGITKTGTGKYVVRLAPENTRDIEPGVYYYDFAVGINGDVFTLMIGALTIMQDYR